MPNFELIKAQTIQLRSVFESARWEHVAVLTYSSDLPFFESYLLPMLLDGGATTISVVADGGWLQGRLPGWIEGQDVQHAGATYSLHEGRVGGAFHPKLILGVGPEGGCLLVGSGNLTRSSVSIGAELFNTWFWSDSDERGPPATAWQLCRRVAETLAPDPLLAARLDAMVRAYPFLGTSQRDASLIHNLDSPLLQQLRDRVGGRAVQKAILWSPFTDKPLAALRRIIEWFSPEEIELALQPGVTGIEPQSLENLVSAHAGLHWSFPEIENHISPGQMVHAKGLVLSLDDETDLSLSGSANLSDSALLRSALEPQANFEIAVLSEGFHLVDALFDEAGPVSLGAQVALSSVEWRTDPASEVEERQALHLEIQGASLKAGELTVHLRGLVPDGAEIHFNSGARLSAPYPVTDHTFSISDGVPIGARSLCIGWQGQRSNMVVIHDLIALGAVGGRAASSPAGDGLRPLDYGDNTEILDALGRLAQLVISPRDIVAAVGGKGVLTSTEEDEELEAGSAKISLADISFEDLMASPRSSVYGLGNAYGKAPMELLLEEIVSQFEILQGAQSLEIVAPIVSDEAEAPEEEFDPSEKQRAPWPVQKRVRVRVLHRVERYIAGLNDERFWRYVQPSWMAQNYAIFLDVLWRIWERSFEPEERTQILESAACEILGARILEGFWGGDDVAGYWSHLSDDDRLTIGEILEAYRSLGLTTAVCIRLLNSPHKIKFEAPFKVRGFVRAADSLGSLSPQTMEDAGVYLGMEEPDPAAVVTKLLESERYFTWDWFGRQLARRFALESVELKDLGFSNGNSLIVRGRETFRAAEFPLRPLAAWVRESLRRSPERQAFQMRWDPGGDMLIYQRHQGQLVLRADGEASQTVLARGDHLLEHMDNWDRVNGRLGAADSSTSAVA